MAHRGVTCSLQLPCTAKSRNRPAIGPEGAGRRNRQRLAQSLDHYSNQAEANLAQETSER
jgi:hypothetical protein